MFGNGHVPFLGEGAMVTLLPLPDYYASMSDGTHIENPRYHRKGQATIARRQRAFERTKKRVRLKDGTYRYGKNRLVFRLS